MNYFYCTFLKVNNFKCFHFINKDCWVIHDLMTLQFTFAVIFTFDFFFIVMNSHM